MRLLSTARPEKVVNGMRNWSSTSIRIVPLFCCCFFLLFIPLKGFCTAFTVIKVSDGWVVGGDSLRVYDRGQHTQNVCKIKVKHGIVLVTWGMAFWEGMKYDGNPVDDLHTISERFLDESGLTAQQRSEKLKTFIDNDILFLEAVKHVAQQQHQPLDFGWLFVDSSGVYGYEQNDSKPWYSFDRTDGWKAAAYWHCSQRYLDANLKGKVQDLATAISVTRGALEAEANCPDASKMVGPPFSMVHVTPSGVQWIQNGACEAKQEERRMGTKK
jgi:hypothetical protein